MNRLLFAAMIALAPCAALSEEATPPPAPPTKIALSVTPVQLQALQFFVNVGVKAVGVEQGSQVPRAAADLIDLLNEAGKQGPK